MGSAGRWDDPHSNRVVGHGHGEIPEASTSAALRSTDNPLPI